MWLQRVKFIVKKSKCAGLAQEISFCGPNSCSLPWLVRGATHLCTSKKECKKLDLHAAQYFWLVDHNDWSMWFAISSSDLYVVPVTVLLVGLPKKTAKLRHLILLSRVTYWAPVEMLLAHQQLVRSPFNPLTLKLPPCLFSLVVLLCHGIYLQHMSLLLVSCWLLLQNSAHVAAIGCSNSPISLQLKAMESSWFLWASLLLFTSLSSVLLFEIFVPVGCCGIWCHWALIVPLSHLISPIFVVKNLGWWGDSHGFFWFCR
jgi:hypothetical protein